MARSDWSRFINLIAFVAVVLIGIFLFLTNNPIIKLEGKLPGTLLDIANILAYTTISICSFFYAYSYWDRKKPVYMILWVVAVVLIVLYYIF